MKTLLILVVLLITFANFARAASEKKDHVKIYDTLDKIKSATAYINEFIGKTFKQYNISDQFQQTCPKIADNIFDNIVSAFKCLNLKDPNLNVCEIFRTRFISCIKPVAIAMDQCLPEKLKGTPMLLANRFEAVIHHVCHLTGKQIVQIFNPCILRTGNNVQSFNSLPLKIDDIIGNLKKSANDISVQNICDIGHNLENLWSEHINKSCPDQMTRDVLIGIFHAVNVPCIEYNKN